MKRIKSFLNKSEVEYRKYLKTKDLDVLAQAGEKLWNVCSLVIQKISRKRLRSYVETKKAANDLTFKHDDFLIAETFLDCYKLHRFFYKGWVDDTNEIKNLYLRSLRGVKVIIARYVGRK